ncbi:MAG: S49 family peptidase [Planctomycetaceae bacterium]
MPRYNATELASRIGVKVEPLVTGPLKDTLNPFRDMTAQEQQVWAAIMDDSFQRFVDVIADNREQLGQEQVRSLATGQIYTASQALQNHMIDQLGYVEDAAAALAAKIQLAKWEAFEYRSTPGLVDAIVGSKASGSSLADQILDASVPKAMYYCSWNTWVPAK